MGREGAAVTCDGRLFLRRAAATGNALSPTVQVIHRVFTLCWWQWCVWCLQKADLPLECRCSNDFTVVHSQIVPCVWPCPSNSSFYCAADFNNFMAQNPHSSLMVFRLQEGQSVSTVYSTGLLGVHMKQATMFHNFTTSSGIVLFSKFFQQHICNKLITGSLKIPSSLKRFVICYLL